MRIREATYSDIDAIAALYDSARRYFAGAGIDQWQTGGPDADSAFADIEDGICYVVADGEGRIEATFVCDFSGEPAYDRLTSGQWSFDGEYAGLHRVAVDDRLKGRGIGGEMVAFVERRCRESGVECIRSDTHPDNLSMQRMLEKNGFSPCGTTTYPIDGRRVVFEKILFPEKTETE